MNVLNIPEGTVIEYIYSHVSYLFFLFPASSPFLTECTEALYILE